MTSRLIGRRAASALGATPPHGLCGPESGAARTFVVANVIDSF